METLAPPTAGGRSSAQRELGRELLAWVAAVCGPLVMSMSVYKGRPLGVVAVVTLATVVLAVLQERQHLQRLAVAGAAGIALVLLYGVILGTWAALALVLVDWVVRRRSPLPALPAAPASATGPVVVVLATAAWGGNERNIEHLMVVPVVAAALVVGAVVWALAGAPGFWPAVAGSAAVMTLSAYRGFDNLVALATLPRVLVGLGLAFVMARNAAAGATKDPDRPPWSVAAIFCAPGLVWWMTNCAVWFGGVLATGSIGHRSWRLVMGALSVQFLRLDALLAAAVWIFTCLVVGASVVISGRRMLRPFVGMAVGATVLSCAVTAVWFVGGNVGF